MTTPRLSSIAIDGFRSINRPVSLRLDAPMVLVHGHNGAGKTSLLSALELGLTGSVPSLERADKGYRRQLANYTTGTGTISLRVDGLPDDFQDVDLKLGRSTSKTPGGLSEQAARFYSERCYLAQTTLSQLLAIYGGDDTSIDTPLSQFAAELLGLDRLDALQRGLQPARDARNLRPLVPTYRTLEDRRTALAQEVANASGAATSLRSSCEALVRQIAELGGVGDDANEDAIGKALSELDDSARRVSELTRSHDRISLARSGGGYDLAEARVRDSEIELEQWRTLNSDRLGALLGGAARHLADAPSGVTVEIGQDVARLANELGRLSEAAAARVSAATANERRLAEVNDTLVTERVRLGDLDRRIEELGRTAPDLAALLSAALPHIHGDDCPVCNRDYSEFSERDLADVVRHRIDALTTAAKDLADTTRQRSVVATQIGALERELEVTAARLATSEELQQDQAAAVSLASLVAEAKALSGSALAGGELLRRHSDAMRILESWSRSVVEERVLEDDVAPLEAQFAVAGKRRASHQERLDALSAEIADRRSALSDKLQAARTIVRLKEQLASETARLRDAEVALGSRAEARKRADEAFRASGAVRRSVGRIADAAALARSRVIAEVFNDRLNTLWRDLFVRLAPDEEFVPSFDVPVGSAGRVRPVLKTLHRSGEEGGSPGVMLSSGNLNTAALTLFLALHLSVQPKLPWLVLDDPVQSMDDVHIAHFAALLRTLSKEHGRQVIVAVHDRALFEYLSLEMTPAFPTDELITVELERSSGGETRFQAKRHGFTERPKIVAAAA